MMAECPRGGVTSEKPEDARRSLIAGQREGGLHTSGSALRAAHSPLPSV